MRRIVIVGLFLAAALALSATAASSALAAEFITCKKTTKVGSHYTGSYKNAECTVGEWRVRIRVSRGHDIQGHFKQGRVRVGSG
jgi:hypothetical protein